MAGKKKDDFIENELAEVKKYTGTAFPDQVAKVLETYDPAKEAVSKIIGKHLLYKLGKAFVAVLIALGLGIGSRIGQAILEYYKIIN